MIRALVLAIGILLPMAGSASGLFPFDETKYEPFRQYLNKRGEEANGSRYKYLQLRGCGYSNDRGFSQMKCKSSDYSETNRLGTRTCINSELWYTIYEKDKSEEVIRWSKKDCSPYERVGFSRNDIAKEQTSSGETDAGKVCLKKETLILMGLLIMVICYVAGVAVSGLEPNNATEPEKSDKEGEK